MPGLGVETAAGIATLTIDNPDRRNSVTREMWQQFRPLLDGLATNADVKIVVIRGAGTDFSSGADIRDLPRILAGETDTDTGGGYVTAAEEAIASFPKPTIAAIDGSCVGGGWEIAGACDIRIASSRATFGVTPARIGIVYPLSGIRRLVSIAGPAVAKMLLLSGELIDSGRALNFGMVTAVVEPEDFWPRIQAYATELASRSQLSTNAMKDRSRVAPMLLRDGSSGRDSWRQATTRPSVPRRSSVTRPRDSPGHATSRRNRRRLS
jgi:enoyl-CoA hydratase/carnithine racemase